MEDRDQDHPKKKKCKKAKWLSGEALQIAVKGRKAKSKGEKERYKHLNAEFQRIARGDKKAFFSDQCILLEKTLLAFSLYGFAYSKAFDCVHNNKLLEIFKEMTRPPDLPP